ncbi:MAG: hypothetical protein R3D90_04875 [Paracoccaceae bacterium]
MTDTTNDRQRALQIDVQRLLGRNMLRLQQYERLLKAILRMCHVTAISDRSSGGAVIRQADVTLKTLGMLVGAFTGGHLFVPGAGEQDDVPEKDATGFSFRMRIGLTAEELDRTKQDLAELVALRNDLVHHFIEQHDIATLAGCQSALAALQSADDRIGSHLMRLEEWARDVVQARDEFASILASGPVLESLVNTNGEEGMVP